MSGKSLILGLMTFEVWEKSARVTSPFISEVFYSPGSLEDRDSAQRFCEKLKGLCTQSIQHYKKQLKESTML
jgi:hypothetical protein